MVREVLHYFLRLGATGFGGPLALIAIVQKELVEERGWMPLDEWQRSFTLIKALPGPIAFMSCTFLGYRRAGFLGGLAAAFGLVFPSFLMMIAVGALLTKMPESTGLQRLMTGLQVGGLVAMAVGSQAIFRGYEKDRLFWILTLIAGLLGWRFFSYEPLIILLFGLLLVAWSRRAELSRYLGSWAPVLIALFWVHFKAGAFVFGSGLAIVPMLHADVVTKYGWLTDSQFMNALAFGQITPGPVVITSTLIGWETSGFLGACVATLAVFLASFIHMTTWFPRVAGRLARKSWMNVFLRGALAAVTGFIAISLLKLFGSIEWTWILAAVFILGYYLAKYKKAPLWAVIPLCGAASFLAV